MRAAPLATLSLVLYAVACGGTSTHGASGGASSGAAGGSAGAETTPGAGGGCPEPASSVPDVPPFEPPPDVGLGSFQVTFRNRCAQTVWPAWGSGNGLDNSVIDTQLWSALSPASERTVTVYGGVRFIGFWGRTGCSFDQQGRGVCQTGDCGGFVCPISVNVFPKSATIFALQSGFLAGYNVGVLVEGVACGKHECVADVGTCSPASAVADSCGNTIACGDMCSDSTVACCSQTESRCDSAEFDDTPASDNLVITFCP